MPSIPTKTLGLIALTTGLTSASAAPSSFIQKQVQHSDFASERAELERQIAQLKHEEDTAALKKEIEALQTQKQAQQLGQEQKEAEQQAKEKQAEQQAREQQLQLEREAAAKLSAARRATTVNILLTPFHIIAAPFKFAFFLAKLSAYVAFYAFRCSLSLARFLIWDLWAEYLLPIPIKIIIFVIPGASLIKLPECFSGGLLNTELWISRILYGAGWAYLVGCFVDEEKPINALCDFFMSYKEEAYAYGMVVVDFLHSCLDVIFNCDVVEMVTVVIPNMVIEKINQVHNYFINDVPYYTELERQTSIFATKSQEQLNHFAETRHLSDYAHLA